MYMQRIRCITMTDLNREDNIGHYNGRDVIFDVKSLKI